MIIRNIKKEDIRRCVEIYNYYIINSTATFEEQPLTEAQFAERVKRISADYPYLVAEEDGKVVGYAYLDKYNERSAYRFTADLSIISIIPVCRTGSAAVCSPRSKKPQKIAG